MSDCRFGVSPVNYPDPDPDHSMQILVNFENGGTCIHRCLLDAMHWIMLNLLMTCFTDIFNYLGMQTEL